MDTVTKHSQFANDNYILAVDNANSLSNGLPKVRPNDHYERKKGFLEWARYRSGLIVTDDAFQKAIIMLIIINSVMMGISTFDFVSENPNVEHIFEEMDLMFLIIFTVELGLQILYHGRKLFLNGWLTFDFMVVVLSWAFSSFQVIRAFRVIRAVRLVAR